MYKFNVASERFNGKWQQNVLWWFLFAIGNSMELDSLSTFSD